MTNLNLKEINIYKQHNHHARKLKKPAGQTDLKLMPNNYIDHAYPDFGFKDSLNYEI